MSSSDCSDKTGRSRNDSNSGYVKDNPSEIIVDIGKFEPELKTDPVVTDQDNHCGEPANLNNNLINKSSDTERILNTPDNIYKAFEFNFNNNGNKSSKKKKGAEEVGTDELMETNKQGKNAIKEEKQNEEEEEDEARKADESIVVLVSANADAPSKSEAEETEGAMEGAEEEIADLVCKGDGDGDRNDEMSENPVKDSPTKKESHLFFENRLNYFSDITDGYDDNDHKYLNELCRRRYNDPEWFEMMITTSDGKKPAMDEMSIGKKASENADAQVKTGHPPTIPPKKSTELLKKEIAIKCENGVCTLDTKSSPVKIKEGPEKSDASNYLEMKFNMRFKKKVVDAVDNKAKLVMDDSRQMMEKESKVKRVSVNSFYDSFFVSKASSRDLRNQSEDAKTMSQVPMTSFAKPSDHYTLVGENSTKLLGRASPVVRQDNSYAKHATLSGKRDFHHHQQRRHRDGEGGDESENITKALSSMNNYFSYASDISPTLTPSSKAPLSDIRNYYFNPKFDTVSQAVSKPTSELLGNLKQNLVNCDLDSLRPSSPPCFSGADRVTKWRRRISSLDERKPTEYNPTFDPKKDKLKTADPWRADYLSKCQQPLSKNDALGGCLPPPPSVQRGFLEDLESFLNYDCLTNDRRVVEARIQQLECIKEKLKKFQDNRDKLRQAMVAAEHLQSWLDVQKGTTYEPCTYMSRNHAGAVIQMQLAVKELKKDIKELTSLVSNECPAAKDLALKAKEILTDIKTN